ncbi:hypothetical protein NLI96_g8120 [Meripilus lineatus]|uniref:Uncharacterized protein n=1 Tax=Meripilus lineatus TaxID=2056292 RepID=A0AAD5V040_9APHY|nr:hypothetical protein NLI96_g8120 [Physisporinus lineatus]
MDSKEHFDGVNFSPLDYLIPEKCLAKGEFDMSFAIDLLNRALRDQYLPIPPTVLELLYLDLTEVREQCEILKKQVHRRSLLKALDARMVKNGYDFVNSAAGYRRSVKRASDEAQRRLEESGEKPTRGPPPIQALRLLVSQPKVIPRHGIRTSISCIDLSSLTGPNRSSSPSISVAESSDSTSPLIPK